MNKTKEDHVTEWVERSGPMLDVVREGQSEMKTFVWGMRKDSLCENLGETGSPEREKISANAYKTGRMAEWQPYSSPENRMWSLIPEILLFEVISVAIWKLAWKSILLENSFVCL